MTSGSMGNRRAAGLVLLLALVVPAVAQQPADAGSGQGMTSRMILELQQMREEVRELRGLVEAQAQEIENLKRRQRDQYIDLDTRVSALGSGATATTPQSSPSASGASRPEPASVTAPGTVRVPPPRDPAPSPAGSVAAPEVRAPADPEPEIVTLAEPGSAEVRALEQPTAAEQQAYDRAFLALREARYADAAEGFDSFLRDHPQSSYAPNALYWLGEVYYVTRDFQTALDQFQRLLQVYPDSNKVPDALLKVGFSHYELGHWDRAQAALEQVVADHPGTNYSRLAENRLRTMRLEGHL